MHAPLFPPAHAHVTSEQARQRSGEPSPLSLGSALRLGRGAPSAGPLRCGVIDSEAGRGMCARGARVAACSARGSEKSERTESEDETAFQMVYLIVTQEDYILHTRKPTCASRVRRRVSASHVDTSPSDMYADKRTHADPSRSRCLSLSEPQPVIRSATDDSLDRLSQPDRMLARRPALQVTAPP